jgi:hypothetical protein
MVSLKAQSVHRLDTNDATPGQHETNFTAICETPVILRDETGRQI